MQSSLSYYKFINKKYREYGEYTYMQYLYIKALLCKTFFEYMDRLNRKVMPFYIYKIYAYPSDELKKRVDISDDFFNGFAVAPKKYFPRIEYRCIWKNKKYKINSVQNFDTDLNTDTIPILLPSVTRLNDPCLSSFTGRCKKDFIVQACLFNDTHCVDVTKRLNKFAGPNHNFFNQPIITKWILKDPTHKYDYLQILYSNGELIKFTMSEEIR